MPPAGFLSRKPAIGEASPSTPSSSILVLGSVDEYRLHAVVGLVLDGRDLGAQHVAILPRRGRDVGHGDGDVVEAADHGTVSSSGSNAASVSAPSRVICTSTIGRRCRGRSSACAHRAADRLAHPLVVVHGGVAELLDRVGHGLAGAGAQLAEPLELERTQGRQLRRRQHAALIVEHQARPGSCRGSSAGGGCGTCRRRCRPGRRSRTPCGPPAPRRSTSGAPGARRSMSPLLDQHRCGTPICSRQALAARAGGGLAMHRHRRSAAGSSGTSAPARRGTDGRRRGRSGRAR